MLRVQRTCEYCPKHEGEECGPYKRERREQEDTESDGYAAAEVFRHYCARLTLKLFQRRRTGDERDKKR